MTAKITSIIRIAILLSLSMVCFLGILSEPEAEDLGIWTLGFLLSKGIGFLAGYATYRLYMVWSKTDKWIAAYDVWSVKGLEEEEDWE